MTHAMQGLLCTRILLMSLNPGGTIVSSGTRARPDTAMMYVWTASLAKLLKLHPEGSRLFHPRLQAKPWLCNTIFTCRQSPQGLASSHTWPPAGMMMLVTAPP